MSIKNEKITLNILPTKGTDSAQLLLKYIKSIDHVCPNIKKAFEKLLEKYDNNKTQSTTQKS